MVAIPVYNVITKGTMKFTLIYWGSKPVLDHCPVQQGVYMSPQGCCRYSVQPRTSATSRSVVQVSLKMHIVAMKLSDGSQCAAVNCLG